MRTRISLDSWPKGRLQLGQNRDNLIVWMAHDFIFFWPSYGCPVRDLRKFEFVKEIACLYSYLPNPKTACAQKLKPNRAPSLRNPESPQLCRMTLAHPGSNCSTAHYFLGRKFLGVAANSNVYPDTRQATALKHPCPSRLSVECGVEAAVGSRSGGVT